MRLKYVGLGLLAALFLAAGGGCNKPAEKSGQPTAGKQKAESEKQKSPIVARVHWLGKDRIAADTNSARFMSLWKLPESARLESQTLDKTAVALTGEPPLAFANALAAPAASRPTNPPPVVSLLSTLKQPLATRLRPLLDDVVREEWCLEMRQPASPPVEVALAIRLSDARAGLWTSNLAAVLGATTNARALPAATNGRAWRVARTAVDAGRRRAAGQKSAPTDVGGYDVVVNRVGEWTLVGLGGEHNTVLNDFVTRIQRDHSPVTAPEGDMSLQMNPVTRKVSLAPGSPEDANLWLEASLDLPRISSALALDWGLPASFPHVLLTAFGDAVGVRTRAKLEFAEPVPLEMEAWNIPTNFIHDPLIGFGAVRGIRPWLKSFKPWQDLQLGTPPNQAFFWAQGGTPGQHFLATPSAEASNQVYKLGELVLRDVNPILATNGSPESAFGRPTNSAALIWLGVPFYVPNLDYADCGSNCFLVAGFARNLVTNLPAPPGLFHYLEANPNLVAYDWEFTPSCLDGWTHITQLSRYLLCFPQLGVPQNVGLTWLMALLPKLSNSITSVELTSPTRLSIARSSSIGFTGVELQLLVDWLESLQFPHSLFTFTAPPPPPPPTATNAAPAAPK
jgi:hypothetical protein